jgi:hypothetical protein
LSEKNIQLWTRINAEHTDSDARRAWAKEEFAWGIWGVPDSELELLGDVPALDVVELEFVWPDSDGAVEYHLAHGEWIDLLRASGFELERLLELQAPATAETHAYYDFVTADWARKWPAEEIWVARKSG